MAMLVFVFIAASLIIIQTTATYSQQDFMCLPVGGIKLAHI